MSIELDSDESFNVNGGWELSLRPSDQDEGLKLKKTGLKGRIQAGNIRTGSRGLQRPGGLLGRAVTGETNCCKINLKPVYPGKIPPKALFCK